MNRNLKSLAVLLALLVTLTACQPTPEEEPVKQKDTDKLIEMAVGTAAPESTDISAEESATTGPTPEPIPFTQRFGERFIVDYTTTTGGAKVTGDVKIKYLSERAFPMYRVKNALPDVKIGAALARRLLGSEELYVQKLFLTRKQISERMNYIISLMGDEDYKKEYIEETDEETYQSTYEEWERRLAALQKQYNETESDVAPDLALWDEQWPTDPGIYSTNNAFSILVGHSQDYGSTPSAVISRDLDSDRTFEFRYTLQPGCIWGAGYHILDVPQDWSVPCAGTAMTPQEAVDQVLAVFEGILDVYPIEVRWCDNKDDVSRATEKAYVVILSRKHGDAGCVYTNLDNQISYGEFMELIENSQQYSKTWFHETLTAAVNERGVLEVRWVSPLETLEVLTEKANLLDFDTIYTLFTQQMNRKLATNGAGTKVTLLGVTLGLMCIREQDSPYTALLVPVWYFRGLYGKTDYYQEVLSGDYAPLCILNAIDGSVIDSMTGY